MQKDLIVSGTWCCTDSPPEFLIFDELTTGLDEKTTHRFIEILSEFDLGYIIISHDRAFIKRTVNKLFQMTNGHIKSADWTSLEM